MKKQTNPDVSIIVPTKNEEKNILRLLRSIKNQDYSGKLEIIVVDNYSTDQTLKLAKPYADKLILASPERSRQRNVGAKKASGKWLLFLDADMELEKEVIKECIKIAQSNIVSPIIAINEQSVGETFWGQALSLEKSCYQGPTWVNASRFFQRQLFLKLGGYDENLLAGEDWDLTQRFISQGFNQILTKSKVIHHEPKASLWQLLKKEVVYIKNIDKYATKQPLAFSYQGSLFYRLFVWGRSWRHLISHPILTSAFIWYKFVVWILWQWHQLRHKRLK